MLSEGSIHTHVHIEKTGGTSVQEVLEKYYGKSSVLIYRPQDGFFIRASEKKIKRTNPLFDKAKLILGRSPTLPILFRLYATVVGILDKNTPHYFPSEIPQNIKAVTGHFDADILDGYRQRQYKTVVLREPLARMVSNYRHWTRNRGLEGGRRDLQFNHTMSFIEYAFLPQYRNYQTQSLGSVPLEQFDLVGVAERLEDFVYSITEGTIVPGRLNAAPNQADYSILGIIPEFIEEFQSMHSLDYQNYALAQEMSAENVGVLI